MRVVADHVCPRVGRETRRGRPTISTSCRRRTTASTVYRMMVDDVPVDGFWAITVYNAEGYFEPNELGGYTVNDLTAEENQDGTVTVRSADATAACRTACRRRRTGTTWPRPTARGRRSSTEAGASRRRSRSNEAADLPRRGRSAAHPAGPLLEPGNSRSRRGPEDRAGSLHISLPGGPELPHDL
jgi:hypothetical protein